MRFFTVNRFVEEITSSKPDVKEIVLAYSIKECEKDKYENNSVYPLYIVLKKGEDNIKWTYDDILDNFDDSVALTLGKETICSNGVACCSISTESKFSNAFNCNYYPRKFLMPGPNIIKEVNKTLAKKKEEGKAEMFDI